MREKSPGLVAALAYNGLNAFEFGIAVEAFGLPRPELESWYDFVVVAAEPGPFRALGGITVRATAGLERLKQARTIVVPGWRDYRVKPPEPLLEALRAAHRRGARFLSICSGAFVLAEAGLLDGRRATTHWYYTDAFRARFPKVRLEPDVLYVDEGEIITSAGSAAGIDACLHLIRCDFGVRIANHIARTLVVPPHREGGQAQYVETPVPHDGKHGLSELMNWARERLHRPLTITQLAKQAAMSERTLLRRFQEAVGMTPKEWLQQERLQHAQLLLESTAISLDRVAESSGFRSIETFRSAFRRALKMTPARYRRLGKTNRLKAERPTARGR